MSATMRIAILLLTFTLTSVAGAQTVVNVIPATDGAWGLDYHDDHLWLGDDSDGFLRKVDPADGSVLQILPTPYDQNHISYGANHGVAWDGSGFWIAGDYGKDWLYKVAIDGTFLDTLATPADAIGGLSFDGTYLLVTRYYPNNLADILRVDPATGAIVGAPIPAQGQQPYGIAYDASDTTIWNGMDDNDGDPEMIWHLTYPDGVVLDSFDAPAGSPKGIAMGGGYMWVVANTIGGGGRKIYQIDLTGAGTGDIEPFPTTQEFGIISLGTPESRLQVLRNVGDGDLTILEITTAPPFSTEAVPLPVVLAPYESIDFQVTFDPPAAGPYAGTLTVHSDDFDEEYLDIALTGTAALPNPTINAAPPVVNFEDTGRGMVRDRDLVIENLGYQDLTITDVSCDNAIFALTVSELPVTLATFETMEITVVFGPDAASAYNGTVTITSNDPVTPALGVPLSGEGVLKSWAGGEVIWWAQGIENVVSVLPLPDLVGSDGRPEVVMETYDAGAHGNPHVALRGNSDGRGVEIWATGEGTSGGWGDLCLSLIDDLDDDGYPEVLRGTAWGGRSIEVRGAEDGALLWSFSTYAHDGGGWVYSVAPMPDVSGDGKPEVLAAAGTDGDPGTGARRIYCFDGATGAIRFTYMAIDAFNHVTVIPDVNGDEIPDVVGGNADGYVYCVSGASVGGGSLIWSYNTGGNAAFVDVIEDVSGDGISDVIAGSWSSYVFCLSGATGLFVWSQPINNYVLQSRVISDVTGDGVSDVAVCNLGHNFRVLSGADGSLFWITSTGNHVWSIYPMPDVDGDGVIDIIAGSQDHLVYCVSGASENYMGEIIWTADVGNLAFSVRAIKDVNGNGTPDVIAGTQYLSSGGRIFCLDGGRPLAGTDPQEPLAGAQLRFLGVHPNPTTESCAILFQAGPEYRERLVLDIYDLTGRRIQSLAKIPRAGLNRLTWDGRDEEGRASASGLYFYKFRDQPARGRIILNR